MGWRGGPSPAAHPSHSCHVAGFVRTAVVEATSSPRLSGQKRGREMGGQAWCFKSLPGRCTPDGGSYQPELGDMAWLAAREAGKCVSSRVVLCLPPTITCPSSNNCHLSALWENPSKDVLGTYYGAGMIWPFSYIIF